MEENSNTTIPYLVYESTMARMERTVKRMFILCIVLIAVTVISNMAWIHYENQFEDVVTTQEITQDVDSGVGGDAIINDGVHYNGESKTND